MNNSSLTKAGVFTLIVVTLCLAGWEMYLRSSGYKISYDDDESLWSDKRDLVYQPSDKATVMIGSSRIKYDVDIDTWKKLTGDQPVQLASVGSSPLPVLDNLANDKNFSGKLIIDVTEILFFSTDMPNLKTPTENVDWYKKRTPAQWFSTKVGHVLESKLVFLDKDYFSLNSLLHKIKVRDRPAVFVFPDFPLEFTRVTSERQCFMTDRFVADTNLQNQVKGVWGFLRKLSTGPPMHGAALDSLFATVKTDIDKIKARGGQVLFTRTPSSGPFLMGEKMGFPRAQYWDRLLSVTNCPGVYFEDYPAIAHLQCPEFSHLTVADAVIYTTTLVDILQKEKGWIFPHKPSGN
ncbi:MAG: hypothetical protein ABJA78_06885 [Ferruginibacter sp.]